jgi:nucleotide-binding universal stress UspA family protein
MEEDAHMRHPIVAGVDGSPQSRAVASVAARLARGLGRRLILAHAAADPSTFLFPDTGERGRQRARAIEQGFALLKRIASTLPDAVSQTAVVLGSPDEALASFCHQEQAELLVVGSVSRALAASAPVPVLVVPPNARLGELAAAGFGADPPRSDAAGPAICARRWCPGRRDVRGGPHRRWWTGRPGWMEMLNVISLPTRLGAS